MPAGKEASRHANRRDCETKAMRALEKRYPTKDKAWFSERFGKGGKTMVSLAADMFEDKHGKDTRLRDK
eukprot:2935181-Lingulodinium_polyedra.AAC.1